QRLPDNGGSRVLLFYSDNGMKFETVALPFAALDINTARDTKLVLNHVGEDYYIHKIWVQGKDYGYELPMPKGLKARRTEQMAKVTVPAETVQTETTETAANREAVGNEPEKEIEKSETEIAQNNEQPVTEQAPATTDNTADRAADETANQADNNANRAEEQ